MRLKRLFILLAGFVSMCFSAWPRETPLVTDSLLLVAERDLESGQYEKVIERLRPSTQTGPNVGGGEYTRRLLLLSKAYAGTGNSAEGYAYFRQYSNVKDSIAQKERNDKIARLETDYEEEKKNKEITEQQVLLRKNERIAFRKNMLIAGSIVVGLLLVILTRVSVNNFRKQRDINERLKKQLKQDEQIERLNSYMEGTTEERQKITDQVKEYIYPVIFEATDILTRINAAQLEGNAAAALAETRLILQEVTHSLIDIGLPHAESSSGSLRASVQNFLDNMPQKQQLYFLFTSTGKEPSLTMHDHHNLLRIIQELVQNIIKHSSATIATIHLRYTAELIRIEVSDNGKGYIPPVDNGGMGLSNIRQRVAELKGNIRIETTKGNYTEIQVPVNTI